MSTRDIDLALSGGGFRAVLFHLGVVACLRDAGKLMCLRNVASVSGGSILAGHLLVRWEDYSHPDSGRFASAATELIHFTQRGIRNRIVRRLPWIILGAYVPFKSLRPTWFLDSSSALLARYYDRYLFRGALLSELKQGGRPLVRFVATNVTDAGLSCFSQNGYEFADVDVTGSHSPFHTNSLPLSLAVAASSAFPALFPPLAVGEEHSGCPPGAFNPNPQLFTDGGVIDNLGIEALRLHSGPDATLLILSDAGTSSMDAFGRPSSGLVRTGMRAADLMMFRIRQLSLMRSNLFPDASSVSPDRNTRWITIAKALDPAKVATCAPVGVQARLQRIRTDLDSFNSVEVQELLRQGYSAAADALEFDTSKGTALEAMGVPAVDRAETRARENRLLRGSRRRVGLLRGRDWLSVLYASVAALAIIFEVLLIPTQYDFGAKKLSELRALRIIYAPPPTYEVGRSVPIIDDDRVQRGSNPGIRVLDEHRVFDLRKLRVSDGKAPGNEGDPEVRGRSLLTRTARLRRDSAEALTYKFWYLTSSKYFGAWSSTPGVALTVARRPGTVRSGTAPELDLYELRADVHEHEVGKAFDLELSIETEDAFLKRVDWWVGMRIADAIDDRVSVRVLFPEDLPYETIASTKYLNETPIEKKTTDGVMVENLRRTDVAWLIDIPEPNYTYRIQWNWRR
jgi:predicted acylesterase/phospholipase RssA